MLVNYCSNERTEQSYHVIICDILVHDLDCHVVADILHVNVEAFGPSRRLSSTLDRLRSMLLHTGLDYAKWVHLAEEICVSGETRLNNFKAQGS